MVDKKFVNSGIPTLDASDASDASNLTYEFE